MLNGTEFGRAIAVAIDKKIKSGAAASKAEIARHFGIKPPSLADWEKKGSVAKDKLPALWAYFADVAGPEHWGMTKNEWPLGLSVDTPSHGERKPEEIKGFPLLDENTGLITISRYDTGGSMGHGVVLRDQPGIIERWQVSREWLEKNVRGYTSVANLCLVTGFGDSMKPTYNPGDPLIVDTGINTVDFDAVYFFRIGDEGFVKRLQRIPTDDGLVIRARSDNREHYEPFDISRKMDFAVLGRVLKVWRSEEF